VDERPVVDGTTVSADELRDQSRMLQDGRAEETAQARAELAATLDQLGDELAVLRGRVAATVRRAGIIAAGAAAVGTAMAVAARVAWVRSGRRIAG
jgi:hypothetical protein